ncbi:tyrosyl-tRNA synthetase [Myxococcus xanthus DK 1622]|uniref:Tyrosine--tRNA ligase n=1 Tax=Myxococcus xanthus (strain DK1622) TaxID=246197 RepID=Q1D838_MYXXD|nr:MULTISPECIES: tyrosine--tRNA ligase [Myxococcus]ABF91128.1 tyrosyl-tRNA synthetase [Myxococcus xanthus DK 1622]NOJ55205.1 tyrosine--tRNA ligase [Myxococcus xanthus]QPM82451.1 tyrosine--tRNA ligase [Myxococcus xanthus]QVW64756.1 tyrosine--tRNA ligase [Myxococcus xanthus DZ2]QZZ50694.1 Tyrosine--tRNA ligase [Myxococcus xanthus]
MNPDALRKATPEEQFEEVTRGTVDLHVPEDLKKKLQYSYDTGKPLVIKAGFDPSRPDLHLGHSLLLTRMRRFQEFGHTVVFLIGDFTGLIGDPTGRNATRPALTRDEVKANAETYKKQVFKVLDESKTQVRFNSSWLDSLGTEGMIRLASRYSVQRMLERDDFKKRFRGEVSISIHEFLYPLLQGYDSVVLKADVELGATDQLFNLLVGRQLMKEEGMAPQVIMTGPILEGLNAKAVDGKIVGDKMSKSLDNYVGIDEPADTIFGKLMSITDDLMWRYYELLSAKTRAELAEMRAQVESGALHPKAVKVGFAQEMTARFQGEEAGKKAAEDFEKRFAKKELSTDELPLVEVSLGGAEKLPVTKLLPESKLVASATEARKLMAQGGVRVNGEKVQDVKAELGAGEYTVQVGKLKAARVKLG